MDDIQDLFRGERSYIELGIALTPSAPSITPGSALAARHVTVRLVPSGCLAEVRVANIGQGVGRGIFAPILAGDELLILFPRGDRNAGVVLGGLGSAKNPNPLDNLGLAMLLLHPGGVQLSSVDGAPGHGIVHGQHLVDLSNWLTSLSTFMASVVAASTAGAPPAQIGAIVTAATDFLADPATAAFSSAVAASASSGVAPGIGGPPHATALHKVSP